MTVPPKEASANYVPAAAVKRREQALSGITGRKELVGGFISRRANPVAQLPVHLRYCKTRGQKGKAEFPV
jgi:hypothetical protein